MDPSIHPYCLKINHKKRLNLVQLAATSPSCLTKLDSHKCRIITIIMGLVCSLWLLTAGSDSVLLEGVANLNFSWLPIFLLTEETNLNLAHDDESQLSR